MSAAQEYRLVIDLDQTTPQTKPKNDLYQGDKEANVVALEMVRKGVPVTLSGYTARGSMERSDGSQVPCEGAVEDNTVRIMLNEHCYLYAGPYKLDIELDGDGMRRTVAQINGVVQQTAQGPTVNINESIVDVDAVIALYGEMKTAKDETVQATQKANSAANNANDAANTANTATSNANAATTAATNAANKANTEASNANAATTNANNAAGAANQAAGRAENVASKSPYIGDNGNWYVYDVEQGAFVDSGSSAKGLGDVSSVNGVTPDINGNVQISPEDVGAEPKSPKNYEYTGRDLSTIFTAAQLHTAVAAGDFTNIRVGDYWPITLNGTIYDYAGAEEKTLSNAIINLEVAGVNFYHQYGDTAVPNHLLFCSRDLLPWTLMFRSEDTTWYDTAATNPWIGSHLYQTLNASNGLLPLVAATDIGTYIYAGPNGNGMRFLGETKGPTATTASSSAWADRGKLFLPSEREVWGGDTWSEHGYGGGLALQWPIFAGTMRHIIKGLGDGGSRCGWWCCSSGAGSSGNICYANSAGYPKDTSATRTWVGAPVCFLFS